jgi:hypothetical protein
MAEYGMAEEYIQIRRVYYTDTTDNMGIKTGEVN